MRHTVRKAVLLLCVILLLAAGFGGCRKPEGRSGKVRVVTTLFPLYDFVRNVGGDHVEVSLLLPPGVEAHSFEPKPGDLLRINSADLFIYTGVSMEPWIPGLLKGLDNKQILVVEAGRGVSVEEEGSAGDDHGRGHEHGRIDPHIWLDFTKAGKMVENIRDGLAAKDPANSESYFSNAKAYGERLAKLDAEYREGLSRCRTNTFVHGGHFAFNYLAKRYNLKYISAYQGSPDAEPTPGRLIQLEKTMRSLGIKTVYYEELILPRVAEVLAKETGAGLLKLKGAHNITKEEFQKGVTFLSLMEDNLKNLKVGLECR